MERLKANFHFSEEDEKLIKKMREDYLANPKAVKYLTQTLKVPQEVIDDNIVLINSFVQDLNYCSKCPGASKCQKATPLLCSRISYNEGLLTRELVPCKECLKDMKFKNQFMVRDFPEKWLSSDLKHIDRTKERMAVIAEYNNIIKDDNNYDWLYIKGEAGTGRTYLAANLAIDLAKKGKEQIAFIDVPLRFKELLSKKEPEAFEALLNKYIDAPILVMDDLGNEYTSEFVRESILFPLLNQRIKKHLFTIITSDFSIDELMTMYCKTQASKPKVDQLKRLLKKVVKQEFNQGDLSNY